MFALAANASEKEYSFGIEEIAPSESIRSNAVMAPIDAELYMDVLTLAKMVVILNIGRVRITL